MTPTIIITVILAYFALLLGLSWIASRRGGAEGGAAFFTGGRRAPWILVAIAMVGAPISGVTFISVPGMVGGAGYGYLQMVLGFIVGYAVIAWLLVPVFYRMGLVSIYGWLERRYGALSYRSGAWLFFVSKILGASVRFLVVCAVLQTLVFAPLHIPFEANVALTVGLIWLYTAMGGVKSVIWTDALKSVCLVLSVVLCIVFIAANLDLDLPALAAAVKAHPTSRIFFFDNPAKASWFGKQFVAGVFMAIATNGLDQDMMQRNLACRDSASSRKNMMVSSVMQFFVIALFLILGTLLTIYVEQMPDLSMPERSDELFGLVAAHESMPVAVGVLFVLGLISAAYSAAGSAMTALTTSFTVDILGLGAEPPASVRRRVHAAMAVAMAAVIWMFYRLSNQDAISAVYTLASYTYGPILGLFAFGMAVKRRVADRLVPWVCLAAPALAWLISHALHALAGYETGFELLLLNALLTCAGLACITTTSVKSSKSSQGNAT